MGFITALLLGVIVGWLLHVYLPQSIVKTLTETGDKLVGMVAGLFATETPTVPHTKVAAKVKSNGSGGNGARSKSSAADDLKKIDGIGPKIAELLKKDGIQTYTDLASANSARLKEILSKAGSRYRIADPSSWPKQAKMAKTGDWDKLKAFKKQLKEGQGAVS